MSEEPRSKPVSQRREAYRVGLKPDTSTQLWLPGSIKGQAAREARIVDLSVTGLSFLLPEDFPRPEIGHSYHGARVVLDPSISPIKPSAASMLCDLVVRQVQDIEHDEGEKCRIGCALVGLTGAAERTLQIYLNHEQVRQKHLHLLDKNTP